MQVLGRTSTLSQAQISCTQYHPYGHSRPAYYQAIETRQQKQAGNEVAIEVVSSCLLYYSYKAFKNWTLDSSGPVLPACLNPSLADLFALSSDFPIDGNIQDSPE